MLARLADKSLLRRTTDPNGRGRYDMHEMIRQFAAERLAGQPGEEAACRLAHGRFFAYWTQQQEASFFNSQQVDALRLMRLEADNLRAAWQHVVALRAVAEIEAFHQGLAMFFSEESWHSEAIILLQQAVDWLEKTPARAVKEERLLSSLLWIQGALYVQIGELDRAETLELRCLRLAQKINEPLLIARASYRLTQIYSARSEVKTAMEHAQGALALFRSLGDERGVANICAMLGDIYGRAGNYAASTQHFQAALEFLRRQGDFSSMARVLSALGANAVTVGDFAQARAYLEEAQQLRERVGGLVSLPEILLNLGIVAEAGGQYAEAQGYWEAAVAAARKPGLDNAAAAHLVARSMNRLADLFCLQANYTGARQLAGEARAIYEKLGRRESTGMSLNTLGLIRQAQHALDDAEHTHCEAFAIAKEFDDHRGMATALNYLGQNALLRRDGASARTHLIEALFLSHKVNIAPLTMSILVNLAACFAHNGAVADAVYLLTFVNAQPTTTHQTCSKAWKLLGQHTHQVEAELLVDLQTKALAANVDDVVATTLKKYAEADDSSKTPRQGIGD
jgi:tetratricopeptide (TPR) repeat protein